MRDKNWNFPFWITWVLLSKDCNAKSLEKQFRAFEIKNISEKPPYNYSLQNLSDVYLHSDKVINTRITGSIKSIRLYSTIALLIVLVATFNYIILSTAVSTYRTKEIGIRKTYGSSDKKIRNQLLGESILLALLVLPIALLLTWLSLPYAGKLFQTQLHVINSNIIIYILVYLSLTLFIGFVSGIYTSYYLSGLKVMDILRNTLQRRGKSREPILLGKHPLQTLFFSNRAQYSNAENIRSNIPEAIHPRFSIFS